MSEINMTTDRKINITIGINGKKHPIAILASEEELYREASKLVDRKLRAYQESFKGLKAEEGLGLVAFQFALEKLKLDREHDVSTFIAEIECLNDELNDFLSEE